MAAFSYNSLAEDPMLTTTYCNPISLPNYPVGRLARGVRNGQSSSDWMWRLGYTEQFRELADVTALWFENKWHLYPSVDMAWVSENHGATWTHFPLNVRDLGYAPTVVRHKDKFLLMASNSPIYVANSPLGPFEELGTIRLEKTSQMSDFIDPMLFSDDDNRLFYYWGCSPTGGIWGVELNADNPMEVIGPAREMIPFRPKEFPWEAVGEWNQNPLRGWMEGAWMIKRNGVYYLTYCAGGTENRTYAMGCYVGDTPLGPFRPQQRNPILRTVDGLITGSAHGCVVAGPNEELWSFYTLRAGVVHAFERRLGMDRVEMDANGELVVLGATSLPQWLPGKAPTDSISKSPEWLPINGELRTVGSSNAGKLEGRFAVDDDLRTWWQPTDDDKQPTLTSSFLVPSTVHAIRLIWRDVGLDTLNNRHAGPFSYRVQVETSPEKWTTIVDRSTSNEDLLVDYRQCVPTNGTRTRVIVLDWPIGIIPSIVEFTAFGETIGKR